MGVREKKCGQRNGWQDAQSTGLSLLFGSNCLMLFAKLVEQLDIEIQYISFTSVWYNCSFYTSCARYREQVMSTSNVKK